MATIMKPVQPDDVASLNTLERIPRPDLALETTARLAQLVAVAEPGSRLPTERELGERLGVGRSTLREATATLAFIGAIQQRQGSGTFVSTGAESRVERLIGLGLMLQHATIAEVIEVRRILEVEAVRMAAERYTEEDRQELEAVMSAMSDAAAEPANASRLDVQYHVLLARASHNIVIRSFVNGMRSLLEIWIGKAVTRQPVVEDIVREHNEVLRAVIRRDPDRAAASMFLHLTNAADRLFAVVGRDHSTADYISLLFSR